MRSILAVLTFVVATAGWSAAQAQCIDPKTLIIPDGLTITAETLLTLSDDSLAAYVAGFVNATMFSVVSGADRKCVEQAGHPHRWRGKGRAHCQGRTRVAASR